MKFKKISLFLSMILIFTALAGCSSKKSARYEDESFTLYVGYVSEAFPTTYMPWLSNQGISTTISSLVYNTLFTMDNATGEYIPSIAKSYEYVIPPGQVSEEQDYLAVKIVLDENATWSDGEKVTAEDVYFTFDLAADFGRTNHAGALAWTADLLHKYEKDSSGKYTLTRQGVFYKDNPGEYKFSDDEDNVVYLHVRKVLGAVAPLFTTILILPEHKWKVISNKNQLNSTNPVASVKELYNNPIGSGPYTLDTAKSNSSIIALNKREDYNLKDGEGKTLYKPEAIKFLNYLDVNVAINALKNGDIDLINSAISSAYVDNLKKEKDIEVDFSKGEFIQTLVLNLNVPEKYSTPEREVLKDKNVREAISLAINQEDLIRQVLRERGTIASAGLMDGSAIYYNDAVKTNNYNMEKAKELLESSGYIMDGGNKFRSKDGIKLAFKITGSPDTKNLVNFLKVQLEMVGIEVNFEEGGSNAVKDRYYTGDFDMTIQSVNFDATNIDMMMKAHFVTVGSSSNYGRLEDEKLAQEIEAMRLTLKAEEKAQHVQEIQSYVANLYYKIPLYCQDIISAYRTDIYTGWTSEKGSNIYNLSTLSNLRFK